MLKSRFKWAVCLAVLLPFLVFGYIQESGGAVSTPPSPNAGLAKSVSFVATATNRNYANTDKDNDAATATTSTIGKGNFLLGFSVFANAASSFASVYDEDEIQNIDQSAESDDMIDEIGEATQFDTVYSDWPGPIKLLDGFTLTTTGDCTVTVWYL